MVHALVSYLLSLSILLLGGMGQQPAQAIQESFAHHSANSLVQLASSCFQHTPSHDGLMLKAMPYGAANGMQLEAIEIDEKEDEKLVSKHTVTVSLNSVTVLYTNLQIYISQFLRNRLAFYRQNNYSASFHPLYILCAVLRL